MSAAAQQSVPQDTIIALNDLYQSAFSDLVLIVGLLLGFAGVLLPLGIHWIQSRQQKKEGQLARDRIASEVDIAIRAAEDRLKEDHKVALDEVALKSSNLLDELRADIEKKVCVLKAASFHVQATSSTVSLVRVVSAAQAVVLYKKGGDHLNLRRTAGIVVDDLKKLDSKVLDRKKEVSRACKEAHECLRKDDPTGSFSDLAGSIEVALEEAQQRKPKEGPAEEGGEATG